MKVIEKGQPEWKGQYRCNGWGRNWENSHNNIVPCRAVLEMDRNEIGFIKNLHATFSRAEGQFSFTFKCPCCGALTDIAEDKIPPLVKECIKNRPQVEDKSFEDEDEPQELKNIEDEYDMN